MRHRLVALLLALPAAAGSACKRFQPTDALLIVDVQNCFMEARPVRPGTPSAGPMPAGWASAGAIPAGSLQVNGSAAIVDVINDWIDFAAVGNVIATLDYHPLDHCSFCHTHGAGIDAGTYCVRGVAQSPNIYHTSLNLTHRCHDAISEADFLAAKYFQFPEHCVAGTPGARFDPYLRVPDAATVIKLGLEAMFDEYSVFGGGRVSTAAAGQHDLTPDTTTLLAPRTANALASKLADMGVKRLFVVGLAIDFIIARSVADAVRIGEEGGAFEVALVAPGARALYSADAVFDSLAAAPRGHVLQDTRTAHSTSPQAAMDELCANTCDVASHLDHCPRASEAPCKSPPCDAQYCQPLANQSWGVCTECECGIHGVCHADGSCTYVCDWPTSGKNCRGGWSAYSFNVTIFGGSALLVISIGSLIGFHYVRRRQRSRAAVRLVETRNPPEVVLRREEGEEFHLFLSHVWSSGQDQVAVIRRRLAEMVPSARVFLDVEDLDDTSRLEEYIGASASVLIFLSKGYFLSRNCLREVRATVAASKPIVLCHEMDPNKGGAPIEALRAECPEELREAVFGAADAPRPVIPWLRLGHFQRESLVAIAEAMLLSTSRYAKELAAGKGLPLYVPGAINSCDFQLPKRVELCVSANNPGAQQVAAEIVDFASRAFLGEAFGLSDQLPPATMAWLEGRHELNAVSTRKRRSEGLAAFGDWMSGVWHRPEASHSSSASQRQETRLKRARGQTRREGAAKGGGRWTTLASKYSPQKKNANAMKKGGSESRGSRVSQGWHAALAKGAAKARASTKAADAAAGEDGAPRATHLLLLLNQATFIGDVGDELAREVRAARATGLPILMVHQTDAKREGCEFDRFFSVTPEDLIKAGLYRALAVPWYPGIHLPISCAAFAQALGALKKERRQENRSFGDLVAETTEGVQGKITELATDTVGACKSCVSAFASSGPRTSSPPVPPAAGDAEVAKGASDDPPLPPRGAAGSEGPPLGDMEA